MLPTVQAVYLCSPGAVDSMRCAVCGSECIVQRNVEGATSYAMAVARQTRLHDRFTCPNLDAEWHELAARLFRAIQDTPSSRIRALMQQDLDDVLKASLF